MAAERLAMNGGGVIMSNVHLKWTCSEAAVLVLRHAPGGQARLAAIEKQHGKGKALSILAHKIGRAVFHMLARGTVFSMARFRADTCSLLRHADACPRGDAPPPSLQITDALR